MFKSDEDSFRRYNELKEEYNRLKAKHCQQHPQHFIIKTTRGKSPIPSKDKQHKRSASYEFYNDIEGLVLDASSSDKQYIEEYGKVLQLIRHLAMELQRHKPTEWNEFLTACLGG